MVTTPKIQSSEFSRVWLIPFTAGPENVPGYEGLAKAQGANVPRGDITPIHIPNPDQYGDFLVAGKVQGERALPNLSVMWRYTADGRSVLDQIVQNGCEHDIQVHMGMCQDPQSFNEGWDKILILERATATDWSTTDLGALAPADRVLVDETIPFTGESLYHVYPMIYAEEAATEVVQEVIAILICDMVTCGACGIPSNGCDIVFALTLTAGGSPGLPAEIIFTENAGEVWSDTNISTLAANEDPNDMACVGINLVVISEDSDSLHFAPLADILAGTETWIEVNTGFVVGNGPLAIWSESVRHTWIVGENGFIYFAQDPTASVVVQDPGVATTEDLNDVHAYDIQTVVAVGANNAVVLTRNGGVTWTTITGPNPATVLNAVFLRGVDEWWIGDAGGQLWYTLDGGVTWTEKTFPGSGTGVVRDIKFTTPSVGFMAHDTVAPAGRILRTIDGGFTWYVVPEGNTSLPANDRINDVAPCDADPNIVYGGGLADDAVDGIIVKGG